LEESGGLVDEALAAARGRDEKKTALGEQDLDGLALAGAEGDVAQPGESRVEVEPRGERRLSRAARRHLTRTLLGHEAAVDNHLGARHERRLVRRQEEGGVSDISGLADAAQRYARVELGSKRGREVRRLQRSLDDAGVDDVGADLIFREL